jgi:uncharacterized phosphosugar-binding protein
MNDPYEPAGLRYLADVGRLLDRLATDGWPAIRTASHKVADALAAGHTLHAFGTGHSHMLAEELYYRAGGLVRVRPLLFEGLMLHASAPLSTSLERLPGLAAALLADHGMSDGDVLVVASNSGGNAVAAELAQAAQGRGVVVIAVTSLNHATSPAARGGLSSEGRALHQIADVVIDNGGCVGDAAVVIDGLDRKVGPTSTVVGAAILNAVVAQAVELLVERGVTPEVYRSSNVEGGDAANADYLRSGPLPSEGDR